MNSCRASPQTNMDGQSLSDRVVKLQDDGPEHATSAISK